MRLWLRSRLGSSHPFGPTRRSEAVKLEGLSTGLAELDAALEGVVGVGGLVKGSITHVFGETAAGKTSLALCIAASVCGEQRTAAYFDLEHDLDPHRVAALGVPVLTSPNDSPCVWVQPASRQETMVLVEEAVDAGVDLVVLDSVGAAREGEAVHARDLEEAARDWCRWLPRLIPRLRKSGTAVLAISQIRFRGRQRGYAREVGPQGGPAWAHWASVSIETMAWRDGKIEFAVTGPKGV